jgi:thermitase
MKRKVISGIIVTMLLVSMVTVTFNIQPILADNTIVEPASTMSPVWEAHGSSSQEDFWGEDVKENAPKTNQRLKPVGGGWDFNRTNEWAEFAEVDGDSAELVIGVNNGHPDSHANLENLIDDHGGDLVNNVSMASEVKAIVADIPFATVSTFVAEVQTAGLSRFIEPNMKAQISAIPNDLYWSYQWGPRIIEADYAWNTTLGDPSVLVAIIDTGIDWNHPDLAANYVPLGYDWVNHDTDPMDDHGHGTHCAGIAAAVINNSIGIAGLAQVRIMAEKPIDSWGWGTEDDLANAIIHAVDQGADILSNSWGIDFDSELIHEAVEYAYEQGVLVVAAAGNEATSMKLYPAAYDEVVAVTATDQFDQPASFTRFGDWVEVAAPGVDIYSTVWDDSYTFKSGTSMSTPHVAGVAALIRSLGMTRDQVRLQLRYTADDLGPPGFDEYYGYGRVNARRAVEEPPPDHDLLILNWDTPPYVEPGDTATVNTTVFNFGGSNESTITVKLIVNGSEIDNATISFLASGESAIVKCFWTPTAEGLYNTTSYVVPAPNETVTANNVVWTNIYVGFPTKAVVLDSAGNYYPDTISNWEALNTNWHLFGSELVYVDYSTLAIEDITYEDIAGTSADTLIISCAYDWEFTDSEIEAIKLYVQEGHGLIATAGTLYTMVPNNNKLAPLFGLNETVPWYTTGTELLHATDPTHPLLNDVPDPYVFRSVVTAVPPDGRWDSNELDGGTYVAQGHFQESAIVVFRGLVYISPWLEIMPTYHHHHLQLLYNAITWSSYERPEHELVVHLESPPFLKPGNSTSLNATVYNFGLNNETNVELYLLINGTVVDNMTIPELLTGSSSTLSYLWTPTVEAQYNVTAYAPSVPNEALTTNNVVSSLVLVCIPVEVLYDESHDNRNFLDPSDPINHGDAWGYTTWAEIVTEAGYRITKWLPGDGELTLPVLSHYIVLVISMARESFTAAEISAIQSWVDLGGSLFLVGEADNYGGDPARLNPVLTEFRIQFDLNDQIFDHVIGDLAVHPITEGLSQYEVSYCGVLLLSTPAQWLGRDGMGRVALACSEYGSGRVVVAADTNTFADNYGFQNPHSPIYEHSKILSLNILDWLTPVKYEHDLHVILDAPTFLEPGDSSVLNATVANQGLSNETSVELFLLINGSAVNNVTIPELASGTSYTIDYPWTPTVEATYNVTTYSPPVSGENFTANNMVSRIVLVQVPPDILVVNDNDGTAWINGTSLAAFEAALTAAAYDYWVWNETSMGNPPLDYLSKFDLVIWTCGDYFHVAVDSVDAVTLESYLAQGGNIILEGEDIGYDHDGDEFMVNVAHAIMQVDDTGAPGLTVTDPTHPVTFVCQRASVG